MLKNSPSIKVYPNPFSEKTTLFIYSRNVDLGKIITIKIYDILGQEVKRITKQSIKGFNNMRIELRMDNPLLSNGMYIITVENENNILSQDKLFYYSQ